MNVPPPRLEYRSDPLLESEADPDPIRQFSSWYAAVISLGVPQPNQMALATATPAGEPSVRMVLLKSFDDAGFVFYTNYESRKGRELDANPRAALLFYWFDLHRQVRVAGTVSKVGREESAAYFATRPLQARAGAFVSRQSAILEDRAVLDREVANLAASGGVPLPDHWGGYRLQPSEIEFWQGRESRLHDRLLYTRTGSAWGMARLYP